MLLVSLPIGQLLAELVEVALVVGLPELASRVADSEKDLAADGHADGHSWPITVIDGQCQWHNGN